MAEKSKKKEVKLNILAVSRRSKHVVGCLKPSEGKVFISSDCFHPDCEYLTPRGWVPVMELLDTDEVWQVDRESLVGSFVRPLRVIKKDYDGDLVEYSTVRGSLKVTRGHGMFAVGQMTNKARPDKRASRFEWPAGETIPSKGANWCCFSRSVGSDAPLYSIEDIWKVCALQADSWYDQKRDEYNIEVRRQRKIDKLTELFGTGLKYTRPDLNIEATSWHHIKYKHPLLTGKDINLDLLHPSQIEDFLTALAFFDGDWAGSDNGRKGCGRIRWGSTNKPLVDALQSYMVRNGYECRISLARKEEGPHKAFYAVSIKREGTIRCWAGKGGVNPERKAKFSDEIVTPYKGKVGCVTVQSGFLLVRHGGQCFVTHNCGSAEPTFLLNYTQDPTLKAVLIDYKGVKPEWKDGLFLSDSLYITTMSRTSLIRDKIKEVEKEHGDFCEMYFKDGESAKEALGQTYKTAKMFVLALIYGLTPNGLVRQAKDAGFEISKAYASEVYNSFWQSIDKAREFRDMLTSLMILHEKQGKPFMSPFGLPLPCGKPKDSLNRVIQSSVSAYIRMLELSIFPCPFAELVAIIHDELLVEVDLGKEEEWRAWLMSRNAELNQRVGMQYPIKLGFKIGDSFYAAH